MASTVRGWMRVQRRETVSFDEFFRREYPRVVGIARRMLVDDRESEDVAQDVFCSFCAKHSPDAPYAAAWLYRAAAHTALNRIRGKRRRFRRETGEAVQRTRLDHEIESSLDPQRAVELAEQRQEVRAALARLPAKSATVLVLRYSGLSYAEVATALGVGTGQIGARLRRAEAALRKEMSDVAPR